MTARGEHEGRRRTPEVLGAERPDPSSDLDDFEAWMRAQPYNDLAAIGVDGSIEEPLRLLNAFRRTRVLA